MTTINVYLTFDGNCREAFDFYRSVFGGKFAHVSTFAEMPPQQGMALIPDEHKDRIMHISLPISKETILMGSDAGGEWASNMKLGNNFSISVKTKDVEEATRIYNALVEGGKIIMPMNETFWKSYFGLLMDKFGINWMVNCELESPKQFEKDHG